MVRWLRSRVGATLALGCLWTACDTHRDVIAFDPRVDEGFFSRDASVDSAVIRPMVGDASPTEPDDICVVQNKQLYFLDDRGSVYAGLSLGSLAWLRQSKCWDQSRTMREPMPATVDLEGTLWLTPYADDPIGLSSDDGDCRPAASGVNASALTTVLDAQGREEHLYMLWNGTLYDVLLATGKRTPLGLLDATFLAGNRQGQLFAVQQRDANFIAIGTVSTLNAEFLPLASMVQPSDGPLRGVALSGEDLLLLFGTQLYKLNLMTREFRWSASVQLPSSPLSAPGDVQIVAMFGSVCASRR